MKQSFDSQTLNAGLLLSLPMWEATGSVFTHDIAKPHHLVTMIHAPVWTALASGLQVLEFDGINDYMECQGADCADLDFTAGDFSLGAWVYPDDLSGTCMLMGRYELSVSGWEWYMGTGTYLSLRASHGGVPPRTAASGETVTASEWQLLSVSRAGLYPLMYRNGVPMTMTYSAGGMLDPVTCAEDLVIGVRYTKNANHMDGKLANPRIWSRALSAAEWLAVFNKERAWFGV